MGERKAFPEMIDTKTLVASITQKDGKDAVHPELISGDSGPSVRFWAPTAKMSAEVHLVKDCEPDPETIDIGWVQVVEAAHRVGIYEHDGKVVFRKIAGVAESVKDTAEDNSNRWFNPGKVAKDTMSVAKPIAKIETSDPPSQVFPREAGGGTLVRIEGEDRFRTTLMAAPAGAAPAHALKTFEWKVPWDSKLEITKEPKKGKGLFASGGGEKARSPDGKHLQINANAKLDGSDGKDTSQNGLSAFKQFDACDTVEAATARLESAPISFFAEMKAAKAMDHDTYWNMVGALWKSNKSFILEVEAKGNEDEQFDVEFAGTTKIAQSGSSRMRFVALGHMVYDPANLPAAFTVSINGKPLDTFGSPPEANGKTKGLELAKKKVDHFWNDKTFNVTWKLSFGAP